MSERLFQETLLKVNDFLLKIGLGSRAISEMKSKIEDITHQSEGLQIYPTKYNRYFSKDGWIAYDSLDFNLMRNTVNLFESGKKEEAENEILEYYSPDKIEDMVRRLHALPKIIPRMELIENELHDYKQGKYYACIPILLMTIDGAVQDHINIGFHSGKIDLTVWDSITSTDTGIQVIKEIFQKSRNRTSTDIITLPYRNGILHGRDLGYNNKIVAAKCWAFLFYIRDWLLSKESEEYRIKNNNKENRKITWSDLAKHRSEINKTKKAISQWKKRDITQEYISKTNNNGTTDDQLPEYMIIEFLKYWQIQNYGKMAELYSALHTDNIKKFAGAIREQFKDKIIQSYNIKAIRDEAPAISEVIVDIILKSGKAILFRFRCIYEKEKSKTLPRTQEGGNWKVIIAETHNDQEIQL